MFAALIGFELKRRLKLFSSYVYAAVLFAGGGFLMAANAGLFKNLSGSGGSERVLANGPTSVFANLNVMALMGLFTVAAIFGQAASQDFHTNTWPLIFTRNVKKAPYLLGRFFGAWLFSAGLFLAIGAGMLVVAVVGRFIDPSQLGPHRLDVYLWPYLVGVWPMLFVSGAVFFSLAALSRQMAPVYVGVVVLVLGYLVLSAAVGDVQNQTTGALADPFGFITFDVVTRYWTPAERNRDLVPLAGIFLLNRALWVAAAIGLLAFTVRRFRTTVDEQRGGARSDDRGEAPPPALPSFTASPTVSGWWRTAASTGWLHFKDIGKSPVYWSFVAAGLLFVITAIVVSKQLFGTATWPLTWQVLELAGGAFNLFLLITITFYAGELVWKERDAGIADIADATRAPSWVGFVSKLVAMLLLVGSLQLVIGAAALAAQLGQGFTQLDWKLYAMELLFFGLLQDVLIAVLALVVQVVVNHKYLGHGVMVLYYVSQIALNLLGVEERLLRYGSEPRLQYSDMNGYGHWLPSVFLFRGYWWAIAGLLTVLAYLLAVRGREWTLKQRLSVARSRLSLPVLAVSVACAIMAGVLGAYLFHQEHVVHPFRTAKDKERQQVQYEKSWKSWADKPMPRIIVADLEFDLFPDASPPRLEVKGFYGLENKTSEPLTELFVNVADDAKIDRLAVGESVAPKDEDDLGVRIFALEPPLQPGGKRALEFKMKFTADTLMHGTPRRDVVENGTFFNNFNLPIVGYLDDVELGLDGERQKYGLPPKERMLDRDDPKGLQRNYIRADSDFVDFHAIVSTSTDQIAVAPGTLLREWTENGRRYFEYEMDQPILNFFSVLSARYALKEDSWNDIKLQLFYDAKHPYNVDRMMDGMKDALEYCWMNFGPYQHKQARILEFPRYQMFAQSFPNTIPYSEGIGFIARVRDGEPDDIDYPYYVTAHEIAHQWWAHQVVGGDVQGATMTSETMAQYSALMVMKKKYGAEKMRRFLKYELDRYLLGRVMERKKELPLSRVENQQYIHYNKGSLAMYWLQDLVGEDTVNRALMKYVQAVKFKGPPYTNSTQLLSFLREEGVPADVIEDLFETITLYDNRAISASMKQNAAGAWHVTVKVKAVKYRSDDKGEQTEVDFNDVMDVGAIDDEGKALFLEKRRIPKGESEVSFTVPVKPSRVGLDPLNKLVDRTSDDNTVTPASE